MVASRPFGPPGGPKHHRAVSLRQAGVSTPCGSSQGQTCLDRADAVGSLLPTPGVELGTPLSSGDSNGDDTGEDSNRDNAGEDSDGDHAGDAGNYTGAAHEAYR